MCSPLKPGLHMDPHASASSSQKTSPHPDPATGVPSRPSASTPAVLAPHRHLRRQTGSELRVVAQVRSTAVSPVVTSPAPASPPPLFAPTTAIIGDSIVRKVRFFDAVTRYLLGSFPSSLRRLILHSETIKKGRFSRLLSLNTWLQSASRQNGFVFINNFNLFWNRPSFYRPDGIHPSPRGSEVLTANIRHCVQTSPAPIMPTPVQTTSASVQTSLCGND
uniref:SGNH hydrolase-type esterase domain-containing protein n=1 Tax=Oryzias melastigma TaxID=30732 RepID=A0A3B3DTD7_ORYME